MNNIHIRKIVIDDIEDIIQLEQYIDHERYSRSMFADMLDNDSYINLLAIIDDKIVGYISANIVLDECSIMKVVVNSDYRRRGIGKSLIDCLSNVVEGFVSSIFLEVRCDNIGAIALYEKCDFVKICERKNYYKDCDAILYRKNLNDKKDCL